MNEIDIRLYEPGDATHSIAEEIWAILTIVDEDFVPRLSARQDTTEHELTDVQLWASPLPFFETVLNEYILLARVNGETVGFSSFIPSYTEEMLEKWSPSTYVSTTAVLPRFRRTGIGRKLNERLLDLSPDLRSPFVTRRTWSTNTANIALIRSLDFEEVIRMKNHRRTGVDTIYFARQL